jgi:ubiquinone/menaquinone biosynthesis C-methylase UbiE
MRGAQEKHATRADIKLNYHEVMEKWKAAPSKYWWGDDIDFRYRAIDLLKNARAERVLEIGCGCGIALSFSRADLLVGFDVVVESLMVARKIAPEAELVLCDGAKMPVREKVFQLTVMNYVLDYMDKSKGRQVLEECGRTSTSDGVIAVFEVNPDSHVYRAYKGRMLDVQEVENEIEAHYLHVSTTYFNPLPGNLTRALGAMVRSLCVGQLQEHVHSAILRGLQNRRFTKSRSYATIGYKDSRSAERMVGGWPF